MATVSNTNVTPKKPTDSIMQMAKDWGLDGQKEVIHSENFNKLKLPTLKSGFAP